MQATKSIGGDTLRQSNPDFAASQDADRQSRDLSAVGFAPLLLTDEQAAAYWNVSVRTFNTLQLEPWFPKPVMLGPRMKRHVRHELDAATARMPRQGARVQPESLLRSKIERMKSTGAAA